MTKKEFEKARDKEAKRHAMPGSVKDGADWAFGYCQKEINSLKDQLAWSIKNEEKYIAAYTEQFRELLKLKGKASRIIKVLELYAKQDGVGGPAKKALKEWIGE